MPAPSPAETACLTQPLRIVGRTGRREVVFPTRVHLAPMEGVTDRVFRSLVLDLSVDGAGAGGACTEFLRISTHPLPERAIRRELGPLRDDVPVGVQFMAPTPEFLAESVAAAERAGASWIDLNFGCPVKKVFGKGAGSALLANPALLGSIVRAAVEATELPVSAKIRAGVDDDSTLEAVVDAVADAGAAMLTIHARRRVDSYKTPARWEWITRAVERWSARRGDDLVLGNGGIDSPAAAARMRRETGCAAVMVGRATIADPFLFRRATGGPPATASEAAAFALAYLSALQPDPDNRRGLGRFKQLVRYYRAGELFAGREDERRALLRAQTAGALRDWFAARV